MAKTIMILIIVPWAWRAGAQSLGFGTIKATVVDASNAPIAAAEVHLKSPMTGYSRQMRTGNDGGFVLTNVPQTRYLLEVFFAGFQTYRADVNVQGSVPLGLTIRLDLAGRQTSITVQDTPGDALETKTVSSDVVDRQLLSVLPSLSPDSALNESITYTTPGVAADSNGFFHPMGDHAQVSYILDGQPISDQRNKVFSTSIPANAIQSMEVVSGSPPAEFGDKTSLIVNATTRSGLGQKPSGSFIVNYGSFGSIGEEMTMGVGGPRWGNFLAINSERTGRFLDTPEFWPMHDIGNMVTVFDHVD